MAPAEGRGPRGARVGRFGTVTAGTEPLVETAGRPVRLSNKAFTVINLSLFFVAWELFARSGVMSKLFFPAPSAVAVRLWEMFTSGLIWVHLWSSFQNFTIGMVLSCLIGITVGLAMGAKYLVETLVSPYLWALAAMPTVALVPLVILFLGFTDSAKIALIVMSASFPIAVNVRAGVKTVDPSLVTAARVFGARPRETYVRVVLPSAAPFVISGVNQGMTQALIGLVVAEMFATNRGLGHLLVKAQSNFDAPMLYGVMLLLIAISLGFVQAMNWVELKAAPWRKGKE